jgi:ornithine cyclodeaminase/alanine dehydrogenase-like protein (mu-crystallin family)
MTAAIDALGQALTDTRAQPLEIAPRTVVAMSGNGPEAGDEMLLMPASGPEGAGAKIVTIARANPARGLPLIQGAYVLFSQVGFSPELVIDAAGLTRLRTAAVSALATRHLARQDSRHLVVIGAGAQGEAHVEAMRAVLPIETTTIVASSPSSARAHDLVARLRASDIEAALGVPDAVAGADVVCTCTTSTAPVFDGNALAVGAHVNAIGAYRPDMCELDGDLLARSMIVVETRAAALAEAGDILRAMASGHLPSQDFAAELTDVVAGRVRRQSDEQITVFKSVGLAVEDLILARAVADRLAMD